MQLKCSQVVGGKRIRSICAKSNDVKMFLFKCEKYLWEVIDATLTNLFQKLM